MPINTLDDNVPLSLAQAKGLPGAKESAPDLVAAGFADMAEAEAAGGLVLTVTTAEDVSDDRDGLLSLREAVQVANIVPGEDTILFAEGLEEVELGLAGGGLEVTDDLVIDGDVTDGGPDGVAVNWQATGRNTEAALSAEDVKLRLEDIKLSTPPGDFENDIYSRSGTGIYTYRSDLEVIRSTVESRNLSINTVVDSREGNLIIIDSSILGGPIDDGNDSSQALVAVNVDARIVDSTFSGSGVAVRLSGYAEISRSIFTVDNGVDFGSYGLFTRGNATVRDSLVVGGGNSIGGSDAIGIGVVEGNLELINSTVVNSGESNTPPFRGNAGVEVFNGAYARIINSTITGNISEDPGRAREGQGVYVADGGSAYLANSVVAGNYLFPDYSGGSDGSSPPRVADVGGQGSIISNGSNIFGQVDVSGALPTDFTGVDPSLVFADVDDQGRPLLADNSGPTPTIALRESLDNPAIGAADRSVAPPTDQRGFERVGAPDIGAFEAGAVPPDGGGPLNPPEPPVEPPTPPQPGLLSVNVEFMSEDAEFDNSLGYYIRGEDGAPTGEAGVLFAEVSDVALSPGDTATVEGFFPADVGFFLIRDGANLGLDYEGASFAFDGRGGLAVTEADDATTRLKDYQVQFDFEEGQLVLAVPDEGEGEFLFWEDKALSEGSYDGDFDDAVFEVTFDGGYTPSM